MHTISDIVAKNYNGKELTQTVAVCLLIDMTDTYYVFYYEILEGKVFAVADNSGF